LAREGKLDATVHVEYPSPNVCDGFFCRFVCDISLSNICIDAVFTIRMMIWVDSPPAGLL
jgi:hypothetical protein